MSCPERSLSAAPRLDVAGCTPRTRGRRAVRRVGAAVVGQLLIVAEAVELAGLTRARDAVATLDRVWRDPRDDRHACMVAVGYLRGRSRQTSFNRTESETS